jgi:hypothetical protein
MRGEKRKSASGAIETQATGTLKPWRDVVGPAGRMRGSRNRLSEAVILPDCADLGTSRTP